MPGRSIETLRVVIADDSAALRTNLAALLSRSPGVEVVGMAQDGEEALEQVRTLRPDVLILDLWMPRMSGIDVLKRLQSEPHRVITIVFTSHSEDDYRPECEKLGARYFFAKLEFEKLVETLGALRDNPGGTG